MSIAVPAPSPVRIAKGFFPSKVLIITIEPMHKNSRLAWMAMRYYGAKIYWPYLYDANKDCINNPNDIEVGTPIRVPRLTEAQLDTTLESTIVTLQYLREQAIEAAHRH